MAKRPRQQLEPKIKTTVAFTKRQITFGTNQANKRGITFGDYVRRVFDEAIEKTAPRGLQDLYTQPQ